MIQIETIETSSLGDRSYLATDGEVAVVIDPQRDIDRVLELSSDLGVAVTHVAETHIHNDYVTGGLDLAQRTGAAYLVNAADEVGFDRTPIADGEVVEVGDRMRVRAIATPGHTFTHLSYALSVDGPDGEDAEQHAAGTRAAALALAGTLTDAEMLDDELPPAEVLRRLFHAEGLAVDRPRALAYGCRCSRARPCSA